ncbi:MAG: helix-turn-helix domain-containing protein [Candidatus Saccharimonadaceae bacterium]
MSSILGANLEALRRKKGYTQSQVAEAIGFSRPTYAQVETGQKDVTLGQADTLAKLFGVSVDDLRTKAEEIQSRVAAQETFDKYKQIILNAMEAGADSLDGKITKTKLAKLVYLSDFSWFYNHGDSMSGMAYRRLPRGPVPDAYFRAIDELIEDGVIKLEESGRAFMLSMTEKGKAPHSRLTVGQRNMIKDIGIAWKDKQTQEIVDFTHSQLPWQICRDSEEIPYGLILQEDRAKVYGPAKIASL